MSSSTTKKAHYERGAENTKGHRHSRRNSGIGSRNSGIDNSSISDRASLDTGPDSSFLFEYSTNALVLREALDAANEKIRLLEAANSQLNQLLARGNKENSLMKREKAELNNKLHDAMDDREQERSLNRQEREQSSDASHGKFSIMLPPSTHPPLIVDERRSSLKLPLRDEKIPSAKSIDLAVISQPTRFFQIGRVFKTLWTEPAGETATDTDKEYYRLVGYGQLSFTKMRRFVVVRKRLHSCLCLAISTYGGQGTAKKDSRSEDHAVVYSSKDPPLQDERFTKQPIPIIIEESNETIDLKSVIDFGRVYTVEHNIKVLNVGRLAKNDKKRLDQYFTETIGASVDLEDESYGSDIIPTPNSDSRTTPLASDTDFPRSSRIIWPPNPMANPFTPRRSPVPMVACAPSAVTYALATYAPMYAPSPISYGPFPPPRPPEEPSKFPKIDGHRIDGHYHTMLTPSSHQLGPERASRKQRFMWSCCHCGYFSTNANLASYCTSCAHHRCVACPLEIPK